MRCLFVVWGMVVVCAVRVACAEGVEGARRKQRAPSAFTHLQEVYRDCFAKDALHTVEECLATKVVLGLDALAQARSIPLAAGMSLEASATAAAPPPPLSPAALEATLPRAEGGRVDALYSLIGERLFALARDRSLSFKLADALDATEDAATGEARGLGTLLKVRKMLTPFVVGVMLKLLAFLPLLLSTMGLLAIKALGASKLAILITGLMGLRKLLGGSGDEGATGDGAALAGGYQLEKSYGLLNHHAAPAISFDYAPQVYHAHHAAYAAHPAAGYYGRAIRSPQAAAPAPAAAATAAAAAQVDPHYAHTVAAAARAALAASRAARTTRNARAARAPAA